MKPKPILCPEWLRRVPHRFSWIDQCLVRDGHIGRVAGRCSSFLPYLRCNSNPLIPGMRTLAVVVHQSVGNAGGNALIVLEGAEVEAL